MSALTPVLPADTRTTAAELGGDIRLQLADIAFAKAARAIARAILAERERCAELVEHRLTLTKYLAPEAAAALFAALPDAIRNPHLPSGAAACAADTAGTETPPPVPPRPFDNQAESQIAPPESVIEKTGGIENALSAEVRGGVE